MAKKAKRERRIDQAPASAATERSPGAATSLRARLFHTVLIIAASAIVYSNTLHNEFHLDDFYRVVDNPGIHRVWPVWRHFVDPGTSATMPSIVQFRPLLPLTLSINYAISGERVVSYHVANILFQAIAAVLVYFLALELIAFWTREWRPRAGRHSFLALMVALIFAVHPVSGIPVNYINARDLLLMELFFIASLLAYIRMRRLGATSLRWSVVLTLFTLSLLSKTNPVLMPLIVVAFEATVAGERLGRSRPWKRAIPFIVVVIGFFLYTKLFLGFSDASNVFKAGASAVEYTLTQARIHLFHYGKNFVWPFAIRQAPLVEPSTFADWRVYAGGAFIVATLAAAWRLRRTEPVVALSIFAYWVLMVPESSVLPLHHLAVDYRPYASSPFLLLVVALAAEKFFRPAAASIVLSAFALHVSFASYALNATWKTEETLWTHSVRHGGDSLAHLNMAMSIPDRSDPRIRHHLEEALRLSPEYILAKINLGLLLLEKPAERAKGLALIEEAVRQDPSRAQSHYWLGVAYEKLGRLTDAMKSSSEAVRLAPGNLRYRYNAALVAQRMENYAASVPHLAAIEKVDPAYRDTLFLKGFALRRIGRTEEAITTYRRFLELEPEHVQANFNTGYALMLLGRCSEAIAYFQRTLQLKSDYREAHLHLSVCYEKTGDLEAATREKKLYDGG